MMDLVRLKALIALVASTPITELDLAEGDVRVRISKGDPALAAVGAMGLSETRRHAAPSGGEPTAKMVRAPMAGTFFTAPSPSDPPFARPGDTVAKGSAICIIEAMKTLTQILSDYDGTLLNVLATNGAFVEYDQPLFELA